MSTATARINDIDIFFRQLSDSRQRVLLIDYDGTIAPFQVDRAKAVPYSTIPELLDSIMATCGTRVVLVSGRSARELPGLLGLRPHPEIWGSHGFERLFSDGRYEIGFLSERTLAALAEAASGLEEAGLGALTELKVGSIAVHWRGMTTAHMEEARTTCYRTLSPVACSGNLLLSEFDGGLELRARNCSKGDAVRAILSELNSDIPVAYLGDDQTDEDAFKALKGRGLTVLVRPKYRTTTASVWIKPPGELTQFLVDWVHACGGDV
ncbi:MAG: trehalose-phosphatase [Terriglobia bacterium]|jgi:trehalose-phosphatase|nr:trehalose-phosphatase [Terriglobia bacterium]